jgi:SAM-dependent methyltransferase
MAKIAKNFRRWTMREKKTEEMEAAIRYLLDECSDLRQIVRFLRAESPSWQQWMKQTCGSFDTQWVELPEGELLATDPSFRQNMAVLLEDYTLLPRTWFKEKHILDAGCGNGRWSYALASLGATVTAVDQSPHGIRAAKELCGEYSNFTAMQRNLLEPLPFEPNAFDMVWSFGVLHHTGNTYAAFQNIAPLVKPGGVMFLMLYGEPRTLEEFAEINEYVEHRRVVSSMRPEEAIAYCREHFPPERVHGWFDAISPAINDLYRFDEVCNWLLMAGYHTIQRTYPSRNLFITACKQ